MTSTLIIQQYRVSLRARPRGMHLVTDEIVSHLKDLRAMKRGLANIFIQHTSASLSLNENADADVRADLETHLGRLVPDDESQYRHTLEGPDDITAHIKSVMIGAGLTIPVADGALALGTWQGIYLGEHRAHGGARRILVTVIGEAA